LKITEQELKTKIQGWIDDGKWFLPEGFEGSLEDFIKASVEELMPKIPNTVSTDDVEPKPEPKPKSETPMLDLMRYSKALREGDAKSIAEYQKKDHIVGTSTAGGILAPDEDSNIVIDLVYKDSNVMQYLKRVPVPTNAIIFPVLSTGVTAYTIAESTDSGTSTQTTESTQTWSSVTLTVYKHGVYSKVSNELLEDADPAIEQLIREDMARQLASYFDWEVFHGTGAAGADGTAGLISGLEGNNVIVTNAFSASGGLSFDNIVDLMTPEDNTPGGLSMFCNPAARRELLKVKDGAGQYVYDPKNGGDMGSVWGVPLVKNNRISKTLGAGSDTAIFSGAFGSSGLLGVKAGMQLIVDPYTHGDYFSTRIMAHLRLGFQVADESHFAILSGVSV